MDDELLILRRRAYEAGAAYDSTSLVCNDILTQGTLSQAQNATADYEAANLTYGIALLRLIEHIESLPPSDRLVEEVKQAQKFLDLLDREADTVSRRLDILRRSEVNDSNTTL